MSDVFLKNFLICALIGLSSLTSYAASCNPGSKAIRSAPDSRYKIIGDGSEVKDKRTGLIWRRCALGRSFDGKECIGVSEVYNWKSLFTLESSLKKGAYIDLGFSKNYRIPTINELESLIETACSEKAVDAIAINTNIFPGTQYWFKSSTSDPDDKERALDILFMPGTKGKRYSYSKEIPAGYVRLVRDK